MTSALSHQPSALSPSAWPAATPREMAEDFQEFRQIRARIQLLREEMNAIRAEIRSMELLADPWTPEDVRKLLILACLICSCPVEDAKTQKREAVRARWLVMMALREQNSLSLTQIGRAMKMNHTSVMYGIRKARLAIHSDHRFRMAWERMRGPRQ